MGFLWEVRSRGWGPQGFAPGRFDLPFAPGSRLVGNLLVWVFLAFFGVLFMLGIVVGGGVQDWESQSVSQACGGLGGSIRAWVASIRALV